jgi:hypothetical protein
LNTVFSGNTVIWSSSIEGSAPSKAFYRIPSGPSVAFEIDDQLSCMEVVVEKSMMTYSFFDDSGTAASAATGYGSRELLMAQDAFMASW